MATYDELKARAQEVKNEILPAANTTSRVGSLLEDLVDRGQEDIAQLEGKIIVQSIELTVGGIINMNNGTLVPNPANAWSYSGYIDVSAVISFNAHMFLYSQAGLAFYKEDYTFLIGYGNPSVIVATETLLQIEIPENAKYVRFCNWTAKNDSFSIIFNALNSNLKTKIKLIDEITEGLEGVKDELADMFTDVSENLYYLDGVLTDESRYLTGSGSYAATNGAYGVVTKVPVTEGKTYCVQGIGSIQVIRIAGRTANDGTTGLITPSASGSNYDGWATITIPTGLNITNIAFIYLFPTSDRQFQVKEASAPSAVEKKTIKPELLPSLGGNTQQIFYLDVVNGNDDNSGSGKSTALKTVAKFVSLAKNNPKNILFVADGVYSEQLNISGMIGELSIIGYEGESIIFKGSNELNGWTSVSGYTGIYSCGFTGSIPVHGGYNKGRGIIYETGRSSFVISENERHSVQKGLSNRLPFTIVQQSLAITLETALADIDSNGGWYANNGILYLKNSDGSNPATNGYVYEYQAKSAFNCSSGLAKLFMANISFRYTESVVFNCNFVERYNCSILGCNGDGFKDNVTKLRTYFDECAVCGNDGANGHYNSRSNWTALDLRSSGNMAEYHFAWMHDNGDDGLSYHEASHLFVFGGLYEYNGDGGIRPSNTCTGEFHNVHARKNGQDTWSGAGVSGSGFDIVNSPLIGDVRNGNNIILYNCISEGNMRGFASISTANGRITLVNCISKDNSIAEYFSSGGTLIAKNCKVSNADTSKHKVTSGTGVIEVESYESLS